MGANLITSRAIIGSYYRALEQNTGPAWVDKVSNYFESDQASEEYAFLGQVPALREFIGGLHAKGLIENGLTIANKEFESTLELKRTDVERDKTGQIQVRINELARITNAHWASLLSSLIASGSSLVCYDGQYFFDDDHSEGKSGTQSNKINSDISGISTGVHGTVTAPSTGEFAGSIMSGIAQITGFVDDQGEPMNEEAQKFLVMVPISLYSVASAAAIHEYLAAGEQNVLTAGKKFEIDVVANARLSAWTDTFAVFRTDSEIKPLIRQEEVPPEMEAIAEGSERAKINKTYLYTVYARRNAGLGMWQNACLVTMI